MEIKTYRIPAERWGYLEARIVKLARKAQRLASQGALADSEPIGLKRLGTDTVLRCTRCRGLEPDHVLDVDGVKYCRGPHARQPWAPRAHVFVLAQVTGTAPKLAGWTFIATLQHEDAGTLLRSVPTVEVAPGTLDRFRDAPPACEHCRVHRRRNDSYVVRNDTTGEVKQVGRNCLGAFLGGASPDSVARLAEILSAVSDACDAEEGWGGSGGELVAPLDEFLAVVARIIRAAGWVSSTLARQTDKMSTASEAWLFLFPPPSRGQRHRAPDYTPEEQDRLLAAEALLEAETALEAPGLSDYEHNLRVATSAGYVRHRTMGLVASLVVWYQRRKEQEIKRKQLATYPASKHVGVAKARLEWEATLVRVFSVETQYGALHIHVFRADAPFEHHGAILVWKTGSQMLAPGRYRIKGTVKSHSDYKGTPQTELSRCSVAEIDADP